MARDDITQTQNTLFFLVHLDFILKLFILMFVFILKNTDYNTDDVTHGDVTLRHSSGDNTTGMINGVE